MGIRTEVVGQIAFDVTELAIEPDEEVDGPRRRIIDGLVHKQLQSPYPRQRPEPQLQHTGPVDSGQWRVPMHPAPELVEAQTSISRVACQPERSPEWQPVLMAIQFPDDLVIAAVG